MLEAPPRPPVNPGHRPSWAFGGAGSGHLQVSPVVPVPEMPTSPAAAQPRGPAPSEPCSPCRQTLTAAGRRCHAQGWLLGGRPGEPPMDVCFSLASSEAATREPGLVLTSQVQESSANHPLSENPLHPSGLSAQRGTWKSTRRKDGF